MDSLAASNTHQESQARSFEILLHRMTNRIRQSLELPEILSATVAEVRAFLGTDRVKIYRFDADDCGEVIAESINQQRLPALLGHHFPADDIPPEARELFVKARQRVIVDVSTQQIGISSLGHSGEEITFPDIRFRPVDPCHAEYLNAMGVQSSLVVPILHNDRLWGLLVSHHSTPRWVSERELQIVQLVADQVEVALTHAQLLTQARLQAQQQATINHVVTLLHSTSDARFQRALQQVVVALQGSGGRLYLASSAGDQLLTYGKQPAQALIPAVPVPAANRAPIEAYWTAQFTRFPKQGNGTWAISDLNKSDISVGLATLLKTAQIRGVLVVPLAYQQQHLGYISVFRDAIATERLWAGRPDEDPRQFLPRRSFESWREIKQDQAHEWSIADRELAQEVGKHFAMAIHQHNLYQQVQNLNAALEQDIQRRKQIEAELSAFNVQLEQRVQARTAEFKQLSHQNELILNSVGEGICGLDLQGNITFVNPAASKILKHQAQNLHGQFMHTIVQHSKPDGTPYRWEESPIYLTLHQGNTQHVAEDQFQRQDGTFFTVEYISTPIRENNEILGAVIAFEDITERQIIERLKDEFVSVVSHELRTPLTSIHTALGLLARSDLNHQPEKQQRMLEMAFSNTNRLVRLVNDILDIERIKSGKASMQMQLCNAADLMIQATEVMHAMAERSHIQLEVVPLSVQLWADSDRMIQTLTNLLSNAIKFSPAHTTVQLTASVLDSSSSDSSSSDSSSPRSICFKVSDQGEGIPNDKLEMIFEQFQQLDASNAGHQGGAGLGLAICRSIIQQHGGEIWAESKLGEGSHFYVTLPLRTQAIEHHNLS
ncbi:MAG: hypothetical protein Kow00121_00990 [Elainellaceae cyanobacterium]